MATQAPAGWYPDPSGKSGEVFWDGNGWRREWPWRIDLSHFSRLGSALRAYWGRFEPYWSELSTEMKVAVAVGALLGVVWLINVPLQVLAYFWGS